MRLINKILIFSVEFLLVACSHLPSIATTVTGKTPISTQGMQSAPLPAESTATTEPDSLVWMVNAPANPINLGVDLDSGRGVEAVISPNGGKLESSGADGTHYILNLPAGSVVVDTRIQMTPVKTVNELPLKQTGTVWAVQLEPDGLQLLANASLTIQFSSPPPVIQQIPFQYQENGQAFNLAVPVVNAAVDTGVDAKGIQLDIAHFSGYGVAIGYLSELEPVRQRLGGSVEDRLIAEFARLLAIERQKMLLGSWDEGVVVLDSETLKQLIDQYLNQVVPERIEAAKTNCAAGRLVLQTWLKMERMRQLLGTSGLDSGEPFPLPPGFGDMVTKQCMQEEYEMCVFQHTIHRIIPAAAGLLRQQALLGSNNPHLGPEIEQLIKKCLSFELQFDSTGKETENREIQFNKTTTVFSRIPIEWKPGNLGSNSSEVMTGNGQLAVMQFDVQILPAGFCMVTSKESKDGQFIVENLSIDYSTELDKDGIPKMNGFVMDYALSGVDSTWSDQCIKDGALYWAFSGMKDSYLAMHRVLHRPESSPLTEPYLTPDAFRATEWKLGGGGLVASKEWQLIGADPNMSNVVYEEKGSFKLYHRPK